MLARILQASAGIAAAMIAFCGLVFGDLAWGGVVPMARPTASAILCLSFACVSGAFNGIRKRPHCDD